MKKVALFFVWLVLTLMLSPLTLVAQFYNGVVKPVNVRDYDGTYSGVAGTGTYGYSTLYRDNYLGPPPVGGEGNGSHPGVDIPCPSGTSVVAIADGTVIRSEDHATWGGLVVIRHTNIPGATEPVYSVYAHLRQRNAQVDAFVFMGQQIGLSGGDPNDPNHGNSTAAHLHFQVDRDSQIGGQEFVSPYWPAVFPPYRQVNEADTDHAVEEYTYHPMRFLRERMIVPVGFYSDGWHDSGTSQAVLDRFGAENGMLGVSFDNGGTGFIHQWNGVWLQDYKKDNAPRYGTDGQTALALNFAGTAAHLLKEGFWGWLKYNQMKLGAPTGEEFPYGNGSRQNFGEGYLVWDTQSVQMYPYTVTGQLIATHQVTFTSSPSGADLYSEGTKVAVTTYTTALLEGETFTYTAKLLGYQDVTQQFTVTSDMTVNFQLQGTGLQNPYGLHLVDRTTTDMTIAWNYNGSLWNTRFRVYKDGVFLQNSSTGGLSAIIYGLSENTSYQFFVTAEQNGLESGPSNTITESTLPEPTGFPVRLQAVDWNHFPTRNGTNPHPEGGLGFPNGTAYAYSKPITFSATGIYKFEVRAKRAYSNTLNQYLACTITNNGDGGIWDQLPSENIWTHFSKVWNKSNLGTDQIVLAAGGNLSDGWPVCIDSAYIYYLGPFPPVLSVDSTALHFGSVDTMRTFHISNMGGPGLSWACASSHASVAPLPIQGAGNYTEQVILDRDGRTLGSYVDTLTVTSNGGSRTLLVYSEVPEPQVTNLLPNGGFESGFNPWIFQNWPNRGTATVTMNGGEFVEGSQGLRVDITAPDIYWMVHVRQNLSFSPQEYTVSFWAKAAAQRTIIVNAHEEGTWINLNLWQEPVVGTSWTFYSYTFTPGISTSNGQLVFNMGASGTTVWLDDVRLTTEGGAQSPVLSLSAAAIDLDSAQNSGSFIVSNSGGGTLNWSASESSAALALSLSSGTAPASDTVTVNLNRSQATVGTHADTVLVTSDGGNDSVIVQYVILPPSNNLLTNGGFESGSFTPWVFQNWQDRATYTITSTLGEFAEGAKAVRVDITMNYETPPSIIVKSRTNRTKPIGCPGYADEW